MPHMAYHARGPFIVKQQENDGLLNFDQRAFAAIFEIQQPVLNLCDRWPADPRSPPHPTNVPESGEHSAES